MVSTLKFKHCTEEDNYKAALELMVRLGQLYNTGDITGDDIYKKRDIELKAMGLGKKVLKRPSTFATSTPADPTPDHTIKNKDNPSPTKEDREDPELEISEHEGPPPKAKRSRKQPPSRPSGSTTPALCEPAPERACDRLRAIAQHLGILRPA